MRGGTAAQAAQADFEELQRLMVGYQKADREAAAQLVERVSPMLLRFLAGPLQTRAYAEDMLQECWLRIHRSRHTYRPGAPVLPWLFAIARYTRIDAYRRRRQIDANELAVEDVTTSGPGEPALADRVDLDLWRLVGQLPPSQQEVVQMLKISGLSLEEVARATGSSVGSVKQKAHRAYQKLRELLNLDREARKNG
jgi:RNA polymerase sigma-70 factor (ECF subfamily)